jgi:hypothetical protein
MKMFNESGTVDRKVEMERTDLMLKPFIMYLLCLLIQWVASDRLNSLSLCCVTFFKLAVPQSPSG